MKYSKVSLNNIFGVKYRARHKVKADRSIDQYFENPIIHREIHGDRIFAPLDLKRVWNQMN